MSNKSRKRR